MNARKKRVTSYLILEYLPSKASVIVILLLIGYTFVIHFFYSRSYSPQSEDEIKLYEKLIEITTSRQTLCSEKATKRGYGQKVISLSLFGPKENSIFNADRIYQFLLPFLNEANELFPDWTVRLYIEENLGEFIHIKNLTKTYSNIDLCDVKNLPIIGDVSTYMPGKIWRFIPTLDPFVDYVSSRDVDSPLTTREQVAVQQFLTSGKLFHVIRDHPMHGVPILGGLWTTANGKNRVFILKLFKVLLNQEKIRNYPKTHDQTFLEKLIWPHISSFALIHDSFTCHKFRRGQLVPFPTQRPSLDCHVGCVRPCCQNKSISTIKQHCPARCRPVQHQDWIYC